MVFLLILMPFKGKMGSVQITIMSLRALFFRVQAPAAFADDEASHEVEQQA